MDLIPEESTFLKSPLKRRRNASNVWNYIDREARKCNVENCTTTFSKNSSTTSLIYHLNSDHRIIVNDEKLSNCDSDEEINSQNINSQSSSQTAGSQAAGSEKESIRRKYGAVEQSKRDSSLLVGFKDKFY